MMDVRYRSTRNSEVTVTASQAILKGLADDGGLFVPDHLPKLSVSMEELKGMTYQETAYAVMKEFLTDFTEEELKKTAEEMTSIIEIMDTIKEIDVEYNALADNKNVYLNDLREDASEPSMPTEKILQNAVNSENCFVVPKVVE